MEIMKADIRQLDDNTWQFTEYRYGREIHFYLLKGEERLLLIDTGTGSASLPKQILDISDLPVICANTHGHPDNISGNHLFPEIFFPEKDRQLPANEMSGRDTSGDLRMTDSRLYSILAMISLPLRDMTAGIRSFDYQPLAEGHVFDLGGRTVRVIGTPSHTAGSLSFLDEKGRLFCGDLLTKAELQMSLPESVSLHEYSVTLQDIIEKSRGGEVRTFFPTHGESCLAADIAERASVLVRHVLMNEITPERKRSGILKADGMTLHFDPERI